MILLARFWCSCESKMVSKTDCKPTLHSTSPTSTKPLLGGDGVVVWECVSDSYWLALLQHILKENLPSCIWNWVESASQSFTTQKGSEWNKMKHIAHEGLVRSSHDAETSSSWTIPGVPAKWYEKPLSHFTTPSLLLKAVRGITFHTGVWKHHWIRNK